MNDRLRGFAHDTVTALGRLRARSAYALTAIAILAVAVASNVAVFTVLSRTLLRPFPFDDERLLMVFSTHRDATGETQELPSGAADYVYWRGESTTLEGLDIARVFSGSISDRGETEAIAVGSVSGGIFRLLRVRPAIGSDFRPGDDRAQATAAILSDGLWRRRFGGARDVVGRSIVINGTPRTIVGVMPAGFEIPNNRADVYVPAGFSLANMPEPANRAYSTYARAKAGHSAQSVTADLQRISRDLERRLPISHKDFSARAKPIHEALYGERRPALIALFVAVLLVHLLACVNVANLMFAQISDQRSVTAVRLAIGASPGQIVRYRLAEGLLISVASAISGLLLGAIAVQVILRHYADPELLASPAGSSWRIALFVVALTAVTALAVSLLPASRESKVRIAALINEGSQRASSSVQARRLRELFIVLEVALAIPLLIGASVAVKRFRDVQSVDLGFEPRGIMTAQLIMPPRYDRAGRAKFVADLVRRLETSPAIESAAATTSRFRVNGGAATVVRSEAMVDFASVGFRRITPAFFETMRSPLVAGRPFHDGDTADSPPVAIVSESFAKQFWPGQNPIGRKLLRQSQRAAWVSVVGVARDIRDVGVAEHPGATMYVPYLQSNNIFVSLVVRTKGNPASARDVIRKAVQSIDPYLSPDEMMPMTQLTNESLGSYKLQVALLGGFAATALLLAAVGIFAVTAYAVSQRMPEVGVRMAFGAKPSTIVRELVQAAARSVAAGVVAGLILTIGAAYAAPLLTSFSAEIDPAYAAAVIAVLIASALLASLVPTLRARTARPAELLLRR